MGKPDDLRQALSALVDRMTARLPGEAVAVVRDLVSHGEHGVAFEWLLDELYEQQVEVSGADRDEFIRVAQRFGMSMGRSCSGQILLLTEPIMGSMTARRSFCRELTGP